jgi:hypothetical protein
LLGVISFTIFAGRIITVGTKAHVRFDCASFLSGIKVKTGITGNTIMVSIIQTSSLIWIFDTIVANTNIGCARIIRCIDRVPIVACGTYINLIDFTIGVRNCVTI